MYWQAKELKALFYCLLVKSKLDTPMSATKLNRKNNQSKLSTDLVRAYLHELGQIPLLNHYEEIIYGQQVQRMMSYLAEKEKLEQQYERSISQLEWSDAIGLSEGDLARVLQQGQRAKTKMIEDDSADPEDYATFKLMRQDVRKMLSELNPKEREVISLRFGLEDGQELSLAKIAQRLNLSRERVRQLQNRALAHLRRKHPLALRDYLASVRPV